MLATSHRGVTLSTSAPVRPELVVLVCLAGLVGHELLYGLCVQDDTFISLRYAANLVAGEGLVYNPGDPVEGYTNFSWTLLLAAAIAMGANPVMASVAGGIVASAALAWAGWRLAVKAGVSPWTALLVPALLAADVGLALESVQGLESAFFSLLLALALGAAIDEAEDAARPPWAALWIALAVLTRPEGVLALGLIFGGRFVLARGRLGRRDWLGLVGVIGVITAHTLFRLAYYGDVVPNTFHAKVGGGADAVSRGLVYLADFVGAHLALTAGLVLGLVAVALRPGVRRAGLMVLAVLLPWLAYVVAVGGDFKSTFRFLLPLLVPMAVLAALGVQALLPQARQRLGAVVLLIAVSVGIELPAGLPAAREAAAYRAIDMEQRLAVGAWLRDAVPPDTLIAIHSAGTIPFASGLPTIDLWGLSDRHIARVEMPAMGTGMAGHEKHDYDYAFGRKPALYLPEGGLLTPEPVQLPVPTDFPEDFEERYRQMSVRVGEVWLNYFQRQDFKLGR